MLNDILYTCFVLVLVVFLLFLLRRFCIDLLVTLCSKKELVWLGFRKWEYYEDSFGSGDEKTVIHMRICQYTDVTQIYDYDKKRFVDYND